MEEICIACDYGEGAHSVFCVRERTRRWRTWRRVWRLGIRDEEADGRTWNEMLFGGGGGLLGFNWNEVIAEQTRDELLLAGGFCRSF